MAELKTLKDLPIYAFTNRSDGGSDFLRFEKEEDKEGVRGGDNDYVRFEELKQEAIKWVKEELVDIGFLSGEGTQKESEELSSSVVRWFKRFNLTWEDLK